MNADHPVHSAGPPARPGHCLRSALVTALTLAFAMTAACKRTTPSTSTSTPTDPLPTEPGWFLDVADAKGLRFRHEAGTGGKYFLPEIMGSGVALFDVDNDGRMDVYLVNNGGPKSPAVNKLFRQKPDGSFEDCGPSSGLEFAGHGMGVAVGDIDNDGWVDLVVTEFGRIRLLHNQRNRTFRDISADAGLTASAWFTSAAFGDYDQDGFLDLAVTAYVDYDPTAPCTGLGGRTDYCHPKTFLGGITRLYRNRGREPAHRLRFEDVSISTGIGRLPGPGLGVLWSDFDGDGKLDLFIANDGAANRLWMNQGNGKFIDEAFSRGVALDGAGTMVANMGVAWGDIDGDGLFDLFVTHLTSESHTLWNQGPPGYFRDQTGRFGLAAPKRRGTGFGTAMVDLDRDGYLDIISVNGRVSRPSPFAAAVEFNWRHYDEPNQLFRGGPGGKFTDVSPDNGTLCGRPTIARGLAVGDLDDDGAPDLVITTVGGPVQLLRNVSAGSGNGLMVRATDPSLNRDAYGAVITVRIGDRLIRREVNPGSSYLCSHDPRVFFGLGDARSVDSLEVRWPGGERESFTVEPGAKFAHLKKGAGRTATPPR